MPGKYKEMVGLIFGRLTVTKKSFVKNETVYWDCVCECGTSLTVCGSSLRRKNRPTLSCGCLQIEFAKNLHTSVNNLKYITDGDLQIAVIRNHIKSSAKKRKIGFELSDLDIRELTKSSCFYCKDIPSNNMLLKRKNSKRVIWQGIDRIDSSKGYTKNNVRPCCAICNRAKSTLSDSDFFKKISKIYQSLTEKGYI
jgi:hypothetical protein